MNDGDEHIVYLTFHKPAFLEQKSQEQMKENDSCDLKSREQGRRKTIPEHFQEFVTEKASCCWEGVSLPGTTHVHPLTFRDEHTTV